MPTIGPVELLVVLVIVVIIFGVGKLPEIGGALGKGIREFRGAVRDDASTEGDAKSSAEEAPAKPKSGA